MQQLSQCLADKKKKSERAHPVTEKYSLRPHAAHFNYANLALGNTGEDVGPLLWFAVRWFRMTLTSRLIQTHWTMFQVVVWLIVMITQLGRLLPGG